MLDSFKIKINSMPYLIPHNDWSWH